MRILTGVASDTPRPKSPRARKSACLEPASRPQPWLADDPAKRLDGF
jgi:hypothetical protein